MKVLIYTHEYPPFRGGIATSSQKIANILKGKFNVVVCCPKYRNTSSSSSNNLKIKFTDLSVNNILKIAQQNFKLLKTKSLDNLVPNYVGNFGVK